MRIFSTEQIRAWDAYTIAHEPIASIDLMERASRAFVDWFYLKFDHTHSVIVVCGTGNNGGDGLAIARMLHDWRYAVSVLIVDSGHRSPDFSANLDRLPGQVPRVVIGPSDSFPDLPEVDVIVDAIFGSGLSRPPEGVYAAAVEAINKSRGVKVAVDIPSGLSADGPSTGPIVKADYTLSFQRPKLSFLVPDSGSYVGDWKVVNIGLHPDYARNTRSSHTWVRAGKIKKLLQRRGTYDHKGTYGHALIIAGSFGKMGAAVLAARGALRSGVGLLTARIPARGYAVMQTAVPEAMVMTDPNEMIFTEPVDTSAYTALGIGPGMGRDDRTAEALGRILEQFRRPVVLDADALNIISEKRHLLAIIPEGSILTPHPKEFERLVGPWNNGFERLQKQRELAQALRSVVVVKGAHTSVAAPDGHLYFNSTGNPGMATGGTGDVLTGVLTSLLAQHYPPVEAAISGVFLHGLAGDLARAVVGEEGLIASDLVDHLPAAFLKIRRT